MLRIAATLFPVLAFAVSAGVLFVRALMPETRGEPMIVAAKANPAGIQPIVFEDTEGGGLPNGVTIQAIPASGGGTALYLAVDANGHIVSVDLATDEDSEPGAI